MSVLCLFVYNATRCPCPRDLAVSLTFDDVEAARSLRDRHNLISRADCVHKIKTQNAKGANRRARRPYRRVIIERNGTSFFSINADSTLETAHLEAKLLEEPLVLARLEGGGVPAGGRRGGGRGEAGERGVVREGGEGSRWMKPKLTSKLAVRTPRSSHVGLATHPPRLPRV